LHSKGIISNETIAALYQKAIARMPAQKTVLPARAQKLQLQPHNNLDLLPIYPVTVKNPFAWIASMQSEGMAEFVLRTEFNLSPIAVDPETPATVPHPASQGGPYGPRHAWTMSELAVLWVHWYSHWAMLERRTPAQVKLLRIEDVLGSPRAVLANVELLLRGGYVDSSRLERLSLHFNAGRDAAAEGVARGMVVKHSASRAWDAAVGELNRTETVRRGGGGGSSSEASTPVLHFTVPLKASSKLGKDGIETIADVLYSTKGGPELCRLLEYCR